MNTTPAKQRRSVWGTRRFRSTRRLALAAMALGCLAAGCSSTPVHSSDGDQPKLLSATFEELSSYNGNTCWKLSTDHYAIYTTIRSAPVRAMLAKVMEGALHQYSELAPDVPLTTRPMECYVLADRNEWAEFTRKMTGPDATIFLQIRRGGYTLGDRYVAYCIGSSQTASVAAHEGFHQYTARHFLGRLPPFLEEGLACTFEGVDLNTETLNPSFHVPRNFVRAQELRASIESHSLLPLSKLVKMHAGQVVSLQGQTVEAFYAQCWAFARFMREGEHGKLFPALQQWISDTAHGVVFDPTHSHTRIGLPWNPAGIPAMVEHYVGKPMPEIQSEFDEFMHQIAYESTDPAVAGG